MFTYRFRMNFEEQEGFSRDIDLASDQTFLEFHNIISENLALDKSLECAFFLCDHRYRKRKRIFQPGSTHTDKLKQDPDLTDKKLFMNGCILSDYIDDPHQKFIYVYDIAKDWNFYIELRKIMPASPSQQYPKITASIGPIPMEISRKPVPLPGVPAEEDEEFSGEDQDEQMHEIAISMLGQGEEDGESEVEYGYSEEDVDSMEESNFFDDSIEISEDMDEEKLG
jgi:hypothetical protein